MLWYFERSVVLLCPHREARQREIERETEKGDKRLRGEKERERVRE